MNKQQKKGWKSFSVLAGICLAVAIFLCYYVYYQFLFEELNVLLIFVIFAFILASVMFLFFKEKEKETAIIFLVFVIIIFSGVIGVYIKDCQEEQEWQRIRNMELERYIEEFKWRDTMEQRAFNTYQNYTNDSEMIEAFYNIRSMHPFLKQQMPYLKEYMSILIDNITVENYNQAYEQFALCDTINKDYSENYTFYFSRFDELYKEDLGYVRHNSVPFPSEPITKYYEEGEDFFLFAIRDDLDSSHKDGFEVLWFSDELEYFESQLEYIGGMIW